jgi:uncharacterized membrane protein
MKAKECVTAYCVAVIGIMAIFLAAILMRGFVLTVLWGWFIVPVFGLPALGLAPALGLTVLLNYLFAAHTREARSLGTIFQETLGVLVVGCILHLFM